MVTYLKYFKSGIVKFLSKVFKIYAQKLVPISKNNFAESANSCNDLDIPWLLY